MILAVLEELARGWVKREGDVLADPVAGLLDRLGNETQGFIGGFQVWRETAFVADVGVVAGIVQALFQRLQHFGAHPHGVGHGRGGDRLDHEFLDVDRIVGMFAAVDYVHHRHRKGAGIGAADVTIQRLTLIGRSGLGRGQRDPEDRVGAEPSLVGGAVEVDHDIVDDHLLGCLEAADGFQNFSLHVGDRREHAFAAEAGFVAVAQFDSLVRAGGRPGWHRDAAHGTGLKDDIDFDCGSSAAVEDFTGGDVGDSGHFSRLRSVKGRCLPPSNGCW